MGKKYTTKLCLGYRRCLYGLTLSKFLLASGCEVYEFNALITAKARKALSISGEKNDSGDAKVISIFAKQVKMQEVSLKTIELMRLITRCKIFSKENCRRKIQKTCKKMLARQVANIIWKTLYND